MVIVNFGYIKKISLLLGLLFVLTLISFTLLSWKANSSEDIKKDIPIPSITPLDTLNQAIRDEGEVNNDDESPKVTKLSTFRPGNNLRSKEKTMYSPVVDLENTINNSNNHSNHNNVCTMGSMYKPDLSEYGTQDDIDTAFDKLIDQYLAPWTPLLTDVANQQHKPITQRMLAAMELSYKGGSVRIRIQNQRIFYRKIVYWRQTYRTERLAWYMAFLRDLLDSNLIDSTVKVDFVLYLGDGPKVAADTFTTDAGFPLFSLRTSVVHLDIPVPDPTAFGSNGNYQWPMEAKLTPWTSRQSQAVFRGRASCLKMQADNWHFCNRVRAAQLSIDHAMGEKNLLNIGLIEWNQLYGHAKTLFDAPSKEDIEQSTNLKVVPPMDYLQQSQFKYIIDLDGGLGSSRKPGIMSSGSVLIAQDSPWYVHWEPLAKAFREYIPVKRSLHDLIERVTWLMHNDEEAKQIQQRGHRFADKFTSLPAAKRYMAKLLKKYQTLLVQDMWSTDEPIAFDYCQRPGVNEVAAGPISCSRGWLEYTGKLPLIISDDRSHFE